MSNYMDEIATGSCEEKLRIAGRPRQGTSEEYILLEEPGEPVQMHYKGVLVPHFRYNCPHCNGIEEPKALWYVGGVTLAMRELVIVELTWKCFQQAGSYARQSDGGEPIFAGLLVKIIRADFQRSPRILRCSGEDGNVQRATKFPEWPYQTRRELARIWGVPIKPKIFKEETGA